MDIEALRRTANRELINRGQPGLNRLHSNPSRRTQRRTSLSEQTSTPSRVRPTRERSGQSVILWSLLIPGWGQLMQGRWAVGLGLLAATWLGWSVGLGWCIHLVAAAEAAWHEYV